MFIKINHLYRQLLGDKGPTFKPASQMLGK